ncbi:rho GTPase-activating protein 33 isoform X2 [Scleropages formosus]|uniref:rho GTPase-activating protein 33 isoform X2 n=1 Tax=Scleropages formosus TaxID=113540 RepID=UPI0010FAAB96|nr:rho GTPase-activating protein 33-like isoform X2 [Scleropages formosus]
MNRSNTVWGPKWVRKCAVFVRAMSLTDMSGNLPRAMQLRLQAQSTDNLDTSGEPATRSVGTTANLKGKMSKRLSVVKGHFPKLADCAHFHYENVDFGSIELQFANEQNDAGWSCGSAKDLVFLVQVSCQGKSWMVRRSYEEFRTLDAHLHQCIYDRRYSQLSPLPALSEIGARLEVLSPLLTEYLSRLSMIVDNKLNCGPVLTWMEIDNHGNRFLLKEEASLNVPAIAAAHVIKRYTAQASDEISIEVGDILSVIDMPPKEDTSWWRGKHGFQVGFFPSECVELINEKVSHSVSAASAKDGDSSSTKPGAVATPPSPTSVSKKHGKLMGFLRTFMKSRPTKQKLKQRGILKERVFGCDLGEHLLNSGNDVPQVLKSCSEFIEKYGVVDGIYRHSGVSSNIQKLRHEFDSENVPDLTKDVYMQDIHCVGSLCKLYFRELPNPLLTYQLYDKFADCMGTMTEDERMVKVHDVIQQLPPPHYRTLEYLMRHLSQLATHSTRTNMHIKNLAIVWAPNLLRSKEIEAVGLSGSDPFKEVRIQSVVVEFLLSNVEVLFSDSFTSVGRFNADRHSLSRPKSFVSAKLLSLEEAQARTQAPQLLKGAPLSFQGRFHTVLDLPANRGKRAMKGRKSAGGSWKTFFAIGKPAGSGRRKPMRISSLFQPATSHAGCRVDSVTLRSAKSEESLSSQHSGAGQTKLQRLRRPRSSSDGLSLAAAAEPQLLPQRPPSRLPSSRSYDSLLPEESRAPEEEEPDEEGDDEEDDDEEGVYMLPDFSQDPTSSWMAEDVIDFSPTFLEDGPIGLGSVAASGRESPPAATPPPYRCISHQGAAHSRSQSQRSITEDPDSVLNQSEAAARRSLILAAAVPSTQVFCQHKSSGTSPSAHSGEASSSPSHGQPGATSSSSSSHLPQERRSFTRKVVNALSPKAPKSPPLDISDPIAISVPAKVLEMIGGRAGELQPGAPGAGPSHPPQMISMLLRSCDFQLTESCQQEIRSKLGPEIKVKGQSHGLPSQQPPPPPPKNPARLMALALAESANKALREGATPPYRPPQSQESRVHRSLSADADEALSSPLEANQLYSTVRPLAAWMPEAENTTTDLQEVEQQQERRSQDQDTGTLSSQTSASESGASNSEVSAGSSSGEMDPSPGSIYKNQQQQQQPPAPPKEQPKKTGPLPEEQPLSTEAQSQRKPPTYSRQFSAPPSQNKAPAQPQLLHSKSECSPLAQVRAFQPPRPKVPPKPLELAPFRVPLSRADNYMRRSLDAARIRRIITHSQGPPVAPLSRAYSERLSSTSDMSRYHMSRPPSHPAPASVSAQPPQPSHFRPAPASEDQSKMENFYYEIGGPEHPPAPPSYARHCYQNMRLDAEGNYRPASVDVSQQPLSRVLYQQHGLHPRHVAMMGRAPQLWSSETTRAWSAAHPFSYSFSHHHHHQDSSPLHQSLRQMSSSVRLPSGSAAGVPLSVHQRSLHRSQRSPSADLTTSQLHPYFENGKVCYRHVDAPRAEDQRPLVQLQPQLSATRCSPPPAALWQPPKQQDNPEPIYVNFPFCSPPAAGSAKSWITTDLDGDTQQSSDPLALPPEPPPEDKCESSHADSEPENPKGPLSGDYDSQAQRDGAQDSPSPEATPAEGHFRSRSDPQSTTTEPNQNLTGKEIASLLIEKLAEDEAEGPCAITSSSASSSPPPENPPNPYPSQQQPTYNVYTPGPSRSHFEGEMAGSQCPDPLRRSASSGGHYRQAFDVMPSGDQVLKFYRMQDFTPVPQGNNPNPYPARHHYQDPLYPSCAPQEPHHHYTSQTPTDVPHSSTAGMFSHLTLGAPRMYSAQAMGYQAVPHPHGPYPLQPVPMLAPYPGAPRRDLVLDPSLRQPGLRNQRGLARQGSLPGPNWTVHSEGQTRSYC